MSTSARDLRLTLRGSAGKVVLRGRIKPEPKAANCRAAATNRSTSIELDAKPANFGGAAKNPDKAPGPAFTPKVWAVGRTVPLMREQLPELLADGVAVPAVFACAEVKPLALYIHKQLLALVRDGHRDRLRRWLGSWCNRHLYLVACASPGAMRHALDGRAVEPVTDAQRAHAAAILASRMRR